MKLKTAFKKFKKAHMIKYSKGFWGINLKDGISDEVIGQLSKEQQKEISDHVTGYQHSPDFWNYTGGFR